MPRILPTICLVSVTVTLTILTIVAIDIIVPPAGTIGYQYDFIKSWKAILTAYVLFFVSGVFLAVLSPIYLFRFRRERELSTGFLIFSVVAALLTFFGYSCLHGL